MLAILFLMFCGCANDNYLGIANSTIKKNQLEVNSTILHNRIRSSKECNATGKTIDALSSFGFFAFLQNDEITVLRDFSLQNNENSTKIDKNSTAFALSKMYEYGYKIEAKKLGMQLLSTSQNSFALLKVMGDIYADEGDYRGATLFYIDALNFEPKNEQVNYALSRLFYLQKKQKQATRYAKIALEANGLEQKNISDLMMKIAKMHSEDDTE